MDPARALLRHTLATLAYRASKVVRDAPPHFATFSAAETARTPAQILAHMGDLFDWALSMAQGTPAWNESKPLAWQDECDRFFKSLSTLDALLATDTPIARPIEILFQGPVADALTHTGQLAILRRIAGAPIRPENFARAAIQTGQVTISQPAPKAEFG